MKLTFWYLLIIMTISLTFSLFIYKGFEREVDRFAMMQQFRLERRFRIQEIIPPPPDYNIDPDPVTEIKNRVILMLGLINAGILVFSGGLGYLLAGKTLQPIKNMMDEQNRFISDASHELKTPLTSLKTAMEVSLRDKKFTLGQAKTVISESIKEVDRLHLLSEELLQLTQYQKLNNRVTHEPLSLLALVKESIRKIAPLAKKKQITIENLVQDDEVIGIKDSLIDLMIILLDNSIKYSASKSKITIKSEKNNHSVSFIVIDQGIGIDRKDMPKIFDRFFRADSARAKTEHGGYGLGLSIAKKIVEIHRGTIKVTSTLEKGTAVKVQLPV